MPSERFGLIANDFDLPFAYLANVLEWIANDFDLTSASISSDLGVIVSIVE